MADLEKAPQTPESATCPEVVTDNDPSQKHAKPGESWKANEEHVLPHNRLGIVFFGLMSCTFLAALDQARHYLIHKY